MLKKLRRKLVAIIMVLVGAVIVSVIAMSTMNSNASLDELVERSLNMVLSERKDVPQDDDALTSAGHFNVVWFDVSKTGELVGSNQNTVSIDSEKLEVALSDALTSSNKEGTLNDYQLVWKKETSPFGFRVVVADVSTIEASRINLILKAIWLGAFSLLALFILATLLSKWLLKPVEEAWQQQRQFIADASHELKTPLAVILANTQILKEHEEEFGEQNRRWIDSTQEEAHQMKDLVEQMLELARTEDTASAEANKTDVDLSDITEGCAIQFDAVAFENNTSIDTEIEENIHVLGDANQLERLTKILIDNAIKYASEHSTITVELKKVATNAQLMVKNMGTPIDPEDIEHLFDRFYRSDKARARETGGFGLGLAIAHGIVQSHNGKIWVTSTQTDGTCFYVKLPLMQKVKSE